MFTRLVLPALALSLALTAAPVSAQSSVAVFYADLDLTNDAGRKLLDQRLTRAARQVCNGTVGARSVADIIRYRACMADARASYQPQVELALNAANARRVAVLADKLVLLASF